MLLQCEVSTSAEVSIFRYFRALLASICLDQLSRNRLDPIEEPEVIGGFHSSTHPTNHCYCVVSYSNDKTKSAGTLKIEASCLTTQPLTSEVFPQ